MELGLDLFLVTQVFMDDFFSRVRWFVKPNLKLQEGGPRSSRLQDLRLQFVITRWWFQKMFIFNPIPGEMIQLD